jgi:hypothetical protein
MMSWALTVLFVFSFTATAADFESIKAKVSGTDAEEKLIAFQDLSQLTTHQLAKLDLLTEKVFVETDPRIRLFILAGLETFDAKILMSNEKINDVFEYILTKYDLRSEFLVSFVNSFSFAFLDGFVKSHPVQNMDQLNVNLKILDAAKKGEQDPRAVQRLTRFVKRDVEKVFSTLSVDERKKAITSLTTAASDSMALFALENYTDFKETIGIFFSKSPLMGINVAIKIREMVLKEEKSDEQIKLMNILTSILAANSYSTSYVDDLFQEDLKAKRFFGPWLNYVQKDLDGVDVLMVRDIFNALNGMEGFSKVFSDFSVSGFSKKGAEIIATELIDLLPKIEKPEDRNAIYNSLQQILTSSEGLPKNEKLLSLTDMLYDDFLKQNIKVGFALRIFAVNSYFWLQGNEKKLETLRDSLKDDNTFVNSFYFTKENQKLTIKEMLRLSDMSFESWVTYLNGPGKRNIKSLINLLSRSVDNWDEPSIQKLLANLLEANLKSSDISPRILRFIDQHAPALKINADITKKFDELLVDLKATEVLKLAQLKSFAFYLHHGWSAQQNMEHYNKVFPLLTTESTEVYNLLATISLNNEELATKTYLWCFDPHNISVIDKCDYDNFLNRNVAFNKKLVDWHFHSPNVYLRSVTGNSISLNIEAFPQIRDEVYQEWLKQKQTYLQGPANLKNLCSLALPSSEWFNSKYFAENDLRTESMSLDAAASALQLLFLTKASSVCPELADIKPQVLKIIANDHVSTSTIGLGNIALDRASLLIQRVQDLLEKYKSINETEYNYWSENFFSPLSTFDQYALQFYVSLASDAVKMFPEQKDLLNKLTLAQKLEEKFLSTRVGLSREGSFVNTYAMATALINFKAKDVQLINHLNEVALSLKENAMRVPYGPEINKPDENERAASARTPIFYLALYLNQNEIVKKDLNYLSLLMQSLKVWEKYLPDLTLNSFRSGFHTGDDHLGTHYLYPSMPYIGKAINVLLHDKNLSDEERVYLDVLKLKVREFIAVLIEPNGTVIPMGGRDYNLQNWADSVGYSTSLVGLGLFELI